MPADSTIAKSHYDKKVGDSTSRYISPSDAKASIDQIYADLNTEIAGVGTGGSGGIGPSSSLWEGRWKWSTNHDINVDTGPGTMFLSDLDETTGFYILSVHYIDLDDVNHQFALGFINEGDIFYGQHGDNWADPTTPDADYDRCQMINWSENDNSTMVQFTVDVSFLDGLPDDATVKFGWSMQRTIGEPNVFKWQGIGQSEPTGLAQMGIVGGTFNDPSTITDLWFHSQDTSGGPSYTFVTSFVIGEYLRVVSEAQDIVFEVMGLWSGVSGTQPLYRGTLPVKFISTTQADFHWNYHYSALVLHHTKSGATGPTGPTGPSGLSGSSYEYTLATQIVAPPSSGQVRIDNVNPAAATHIFLHELTVDGFDVEIPLTVVAVGDIIIVQDKDESDKRVRYSVTSATFANNYLDVGVSWVLTGIDGPPPAGQRVLVYVFKASTVGGGSASNSDQNILANQIFS